MSLPKRSHLIAASVVSAFALAAACSIPPSPIVSPTLPPPSADVAVSPVPNVPAASVITITTPLEKPTGKVVTKLAAVIDPGPNDDRPQVDCSYERSFRGVIGNGTHVSLRLHRDAAGKLSGRAHYDVPGPGLAVSGEVKTDGSFVLKETGGGTFTGSCATGVGSLVGLYSKDQPFELAPRPAGEPSLYLSVTSAEGFMKNPPGCVKAPRSPLPQLVEGVGLCFAADDRERLKSHEDFSATQGTCGLRGVLPQVFGLPDAAAEKRVNDALGPAGRSWSSAATVAEVKSCPYDAASGQRYVWGTYELAYADRDVLGVLLTSGETANRSARAPSETVNVDLVAGRRVDLGDVIANEPKFRQIIQGCLPLYRSTMPAYLTSPDDFASHFDWKPPQVPLWIVVPGGLALLSAFEGADVDLSGSGPIVTWDALLREGVLRADSPVKRLWNNTNPARPETAACTQVYWKSSLWRELTPADGTGKSPND